MTRSALLVLAAVSAFAMQYGGADYVYWLDKESMNPDGFGRTVTVSLTVHSLRGVVLALVDAELALLVRQSRRGEFLLHRLLAGSTAIFIVRTSNLRSLCGCDLFCDDNSVFNMTLAVGGPEQGHDVMVKCSDTQLNISQIHLPPNDPFYFSTDSVPRVNRGQILIMVGNKGPYPLSHEGGQSHFSASEGRSLEGCVNGIWLGRQRLANLKVVGTDLLANCKRPQESSRSSNYTEEPTKSMTEDDKNEDAPVTSASTVNQTVSYAKMLIFGCAVVVALMGLILSGLVLAVCRVERFLQRRQDIELRRGIRHRSTNEVHATTNESQVVESCIDKSPLKMENDQFQSVSLGVSQSEENMHADQ